ncbi:MAG: divalent metal cation transporter, partial [Bacteroidota bacterium]|nr:divalent metal cation transporter [Bacteroidota bacterium]
ETFNWRQGLDKKFNQAPGFYVALIVSLMAGLCLDFLNISPIQALIYTAVLYGLTSPVMIAVVLHICNNPKIMGTSVNRKGTNILGVTALILMTAAAVALLWFQFAH